MSAFTPASEVLLHHNDDLKQSRILFAGDLQDSLPARLDTTASRAHTQRFRHWRMLNRQMGDNARFSLVATAGDVVDCDTLIHYQLRNKPETQFQSMNLLSLLPVGTGILVVDEDRSGVRNTEQMLADYTPLNEANNARRYGLYSDRLEKQPVFDTSKFWGEYSVDGLTVKTLPGVLNHDGLDVGSQLLPSTLTPHTKSKVPDVGCDAEVLSIAFTHHSPKIRLAPCDVSAPAIEASRAIPATNNVEGEVFTSNVFSEVKGRFDMTISNPSFHDGTQTNPDATQTSIRGAVYHLSSGDEL